MRPQNTTISSQAQQAALDELYGLGYNYDKTFDERIRCKGDAACGIQPSSCRRAGLC